MQYLSICILLISLIIVINACSPSLTNPSVNNQRLFPEKYRGLRRREDEQLSELDDDDDDDDDSDADESLESTCEQAMAMIVRHRNFPKLDPTVLLGYCPHYNERLILAQQNKTLWENNKQETQELNKKRYDVDDDDDHDDRRHALRRQELKKRFALRFIRKRNVKKF